MKLGHPAKVILRPVLILLSLAISLPLCFPASVSPASSASQIHWRLRHRLESAGEPPHIVVKSARIHAARTMLTFYQRRLYEPAWWKDTRPSPDARSLVDALRRARDEGLNPLDYHLSGIEALLAEIRVALDRGATIDIGDMVDLDLLLTDAFLLYGSHCLAGHLDPETLDPEWFAQRREADLATILEEALAEHQVSESIRGLLPPQAGYARLRTALAEYRSLAQKGGWSLLPEGPTMRAGDRGDAVRALRNRLQISGDLDKSPSAEPDLFDGSLDQAVRRFQWRNGLDVDGLVGPATRSALNMGVEARIRQIRVNLERWRWLPQDLGRRHIIVNIADFHLDVMEGEKEALTMKVIVGRDYRRTPVFSGRMTYLVINPSWEVPPGIIAQDIIPALRKDPLYTRTKGIRILRGWGGDQREIAPESIDWSRVPTNACPYRFRQDPGPSNPLGRIKFMFPNKFNVYLHDTPSPELFTHHDRTLSSGCVRVEKPLELAAFLLAGDPRWTPADIQAAIATQKETMVGIPDPLPVHLLYWTVWVDEEGITHFRRDVYGRDARVNDALQEEPPAPSASFD